MNNSRDTFIPNEIERRLNWKKINILGTEYTIHRRTMEEDVQLHEANGYCDTSTKEIIVEICSKERGSLKDLHTFEEKVLRHEIIHAFLYESGLGHGSWGANEEIVDWIAIQFPKISKIINEVK